jgi:hypothetical protein
LYLICLGGAKLGDESKYSGVAGEWKSWLLIQNNPFTGYYIPVNKENPGTYILKIYGSKGEVPDVKNIMH